jgi:hypothetical protein
MGTKKTNKNVKVKKLEKHKPIFSAQFRSIRIAPSCTRQRNTR